MAVSGRSKALKYWLPALLCALLMARAQAVEPQPFDYWMLALSWSPQYCEGKSGSDPQCGGQRYGFIVHGLWPALEPASARQCPKAGPMPKAAVQRLLPLTPSSRLIQHEWNKHGACTGWPVNEYVAAVENAWRSVKIPHRYVGLAAPLSTTPAEIEDQFMLFNPGYDGSGISLQCSGRWLREVRLCMDRQFKARSCGAEIADRCGARVFLRPEK